MKIITNGIRRLLSDKADTFTFHQCTENDFVLSPKKDFGLYLHIPFCRSLCSYCPYNKILFDQSVAENYVEAVCGEIQQVAQRIGRQKFSSLYIGGGTPTLLMPSLEKIIFEIRKHFLLDGPIAIETTPSDLSDDRLKEIKNIDIDYISLGVQSFQQKYLSFLGRNHDAAMTSQAVSLLGDKEFKVANVDMIFAYPGQTIAELNDDLRQCIFFQPEQVTCYPLFTFPYSKVGKFLKLKKVRMPNWIVRRKMYYAIIDFFTKAGYRQSSVWSFNKNKDFKYSSVTRDYYIGFGAGAASYTGNNFYFNTFSVPQYIRATRERIPVALKMKVSKRLEKLFWLYWRFYDTRIPSADYERIFGEALSSNFGKEIQICKMFGFFRDDDRDILSLNKRGAFWIHLLQNQFALNYVNTIWTKCQEESWPLKIAI